MIELVLPTPMPYSGSLSHRTIVQARMIEVISPAPLMTIFRWATGELSKIFGLYHGRIVAATRCRGT